MKPSDIALLAAISLTAIACSGGGSSGDRTVDNSAVLSGQFADSPVEGLTFRTATQSGVTDAAGTFRYGAGETITFTIGGTVVGDPVLATSLMTPRDLVPGAPLYTTAAEIQRASLRPRSAETLAFLRFVSILVFLQSLDEDGDPANGIMINDGIAALLDGIQIEFDSDVRKLSPLSDPLYWRGGSTLRHILHRAMDLGYVSTAAPRRIGIAMDHFYGEQGIITRVARKSGQEIDIDAATDPGANETITYDYDIDGNLSGQRQDADGDGSADVIWTYTYRAAGDPAGSGVDFDGDGIEDEVWTYTYDPAGDVTEVSQVIIGAGGSTIFWQDWNFGYDDIGNRVTGSTTAPFGDEAWTDTYDAGGNLIRHNWDDGVLDVDTVYTYDGNGNPTGVTTDYGNDGIVDETITYAYDAAGNVIMETRDGNGDGQADRIITTIYNTDGNPTSKVADYDGDGIAESIETFIYDAAGNLISERLDSDGDGNTNSMLDFDYDSNGNRTGKSGDTDGNGIVDFIAFYSYDDDGNLINEARDTNGDGSVDLAISFTYEDGNWRSIQQDLSQFFVL